MDERSWQERALERLRRNNTLPGAILLAVLGRATVLPRLGRSAVLSADGWIFTSVTRAKDGWHAKVPVCHVDDYVKTFRTLADVLKLDTEDRKALFFELKAWIKHDHSAKYDIEERLGIKPDDKRLKGVIHK